MHDLPSEIYRKIFQYLNQRNLQTCYFVCKRWYSIAILLNWESVTLHDFKIDLIKSHLNDSNYREYFKYAHLITKLTIDTNYSFMDAYWLGTCLQKNKPAEDWYKFRKQELLLLLDQLPSLSVIDMRGSQFAGLYLNALLDVNEMNINKIEVEHKISLAGDRCSYGLYFLVCYKFRHSISSMILHYSSRTLDFNSQEIDVLNSLTQFEQLTQLEFHNKLDAGLTPYHVRDICSKLKHFKFVSGFLLTENLMLYILRNGRNVDLNFIAGLTHLELELPSLSPTYTKSIVEYFTNQLVTVHINIFHQVLFHWIDIVGMELALKFMKTIGSTKEVFVGFEHNIKYEVHENDETNMTKYFTLLNAFRGNRQAPCSVEFPHPYEDFGHPNEDLENPSHSFKFNSSGNLRITYGTYFDDFDGFNTDMNLPDKTISIIGPEIFDNLRFGIHLKNIVRQSLNYSFLNCPKLQNFEVISDEFQYKYRSSSIEYKHIEDPTSSGKVNRYINYLKIGFLSPTQTYFDMVKNYLHNIETVSIRTLDWGRLYNDSVINLTCFKKLKKFDYCTEISSNERYTISDDFIWINFTNGKRLYYYLDEKKNKRPEIEYAKNPVTPCLTLLCDISVSFHFHKELVI